MAWKGVSNAFVANIYTAHDFVLFRSPRTAVTGYILRGGFSKTYEITPCASGQVLTFCKKLKFIVLNAKKDKKSGVV